MDNDWASPFNTKEGPDFVTPHSHSDWRLTVFNFGILGFIGYFLFKTTELDINVESLTEAHNKLNVGVDNGFKIFNNNDQILEQALRDHNDDPYSHGRF